MTPQFKHDCDKCKLIPQLNGADIYECVTTVLVRESDKPSDNRTWPKEMLEQIVENFPQDYIWSVALMAVTHETIRRLH